MNWTLRIRSCGLCKVLEPPDWLRESLGWKCSSLAHVSALFFGQIHSQALLFLSSYSQPVLDCHSLSQTRRQSPLHTQPSSLSSSLKSLFCLLLLRTDLCPIFAPTLNRLRWSRYKLLGRLGPYGSVRSVHFRTNSVRPRPKFAHSTIHLQTPSMPS